MQNDYRTTPIYVVAERIVCSYGGRVLRHTMRYHRSRLYCRYYASVVPTKLM